MTGDAKILAEYSLRTLDVGLYSFTWGNELVFIKCNEETNYYFIVTTHDEKVLKQIQLFVQEKLIPTMLGV